MKQKHTQYNSIKRDINRVLLLISLIILYIRDTPNDNYQQHILYFNFFLLDNRTKKTLTGHIYIT